MLTKKRKIWAAARGGATFVGERLHYPAGVADRYRKRLSALTERMTREVTRAVRELFDTDHAAAHFGTDASIGSQARILLNALSAKFQALFAQAAQPMAEQMVDGAAKASSSSLHSSLEKLSGGLSLKTNVGNPILDNIYKASVAENVSLIKSIPQQYIDKVQGAVMRSITTGNGLSDLIPALAQYEGQTHRRAELIALDQTRKAYSSINKGRMQAIGIKKFMWHHSGGGAHPREDHVEMDGEIFSFDDPPVIDQRTGERGIPGQAVNCRCVASPIFDFEIT